MQNKLATAGPFGAGKPFQLKFNGAWLPNVPSLHVGVGNYTTLSNMRYTDTGIETVEGYEQLTTTALSETMLNGFHFRKNDESHFITKFMSPGSNVYLADNMTAIPVAGDYETSYLNNTSAMGYISLSHDAGSFSNGPAGTMLYADESNTLVYGGDKMAVQAVFVSPTGFAPTFIDGTEFVNNDLTGETITLSATNPHLFIGSPIKINSIDVTIENGNTTTSTLSGYVWTASTWGALTGLSDGTSSGGATLNQSGTISFTHSFGTSKEMYIGGSVLYWYRFELSAGSAEISKITVSSPLQPVTDVWNGSGRTCTSFQALRSGAYEDYTYHVAQKSTEDAPYAATIGGLGASDYIYVMFDDRAMGFDISMLGSKVNAATASVSDVSYWNGIAYASVGYINDETKPGSVSFSKSGTICWSPPGIDTEHPKYEFGKYGYVYRISLSATLTDGTGHDGTSIDSLTGIAAPVKTSGYERVGFYAGRVMLIKNNQVDYSLPDSPWTYNGVNTSDGGRSSLYFGDINPITATSSIFNRYGSNIIESWVVTKQSETYLLTGSQPFADYGEPFIVKAISSNIGCPAPMTMKNVEVGFEITQEARRNAVIWLDSNGPVIFDGAVLTPLAGIENYFDPNNSECVRHSMLDKATAYVDTVAYEYNLIFPSGDAAAGNNTWLVYSLKHNKWYKKTPTYYPIYTAPVRDTNGGKYNYMHTSTGHLYRLDYGQSWDGTTIAQEIMTGEFSPPIADELGFWAQSELSALRLLSNPITEDRDVTISVYGDGVLSSKMITFPLNSGGVLSRNTAGDKSFGIQNYIYQVKFSASSSSEKWEPLAWGYKAIMIRED